MRPKALDCHIFMDIPRRDNLAPGPCPGEFILTLGKHGYGTAYLVLAAREVRRRDPRAPRRFQMRVQRAAVSEALGFGFWTLEWYPRVRARMREAREPEFSKGRT